MPETSPKTRTTVIGGAALDLPAPTVMAAGMGDAKYTQTYLEAAVPKPVRKHVRADEGGARRLVVDAAEPAPTVMAGGIGSVNTSQYLVGAGPPPPAAADKPPYRVPPMAELPGVPWNGFRAVSTFSGCGGSSLGYRLAGFKVLWASEFVPAARDCYAANFPTTILDGRDIREVTPEDVLAAVGLEAGELDLLDGSPPCASFSTAGKRAEGWGKVKKYSDVEQRTDDLFFEFVRLLKGIRPRTFVAENVSGLVKGVAKGYFLEILAALKGAGYRVACRVLDAQWLGVPQARQRTIFVGVREDLADAAGRPIMPCHPGPLPYRYSVRDAIPWIGDTVSNSRIERVVDKGSDEPSMTVRANRAAHMMTSNSAGRETLKPLTEPSPTITKSAGGAGGSGRGGELVIVQRQGSAGLPRGGKPVSPDRPLPTVCGTQAQQELLGRVGPEVLIGANGGFGGERWKSADTEPAATIGAGPSTGNGRSSGGMVKEVSPVDGAVERRKFSIAELKRICAFPDDFILIGSYAQQWERLGRAVPPLMMRAVAECVRDRILRAYPEALAAAQVRLAAAAAAPARKAGPRAVRRKGG